MEFVEYAFQTGSVSDYLIVWACIAGLIALAIDDPIDELCEIVLITMIWPVTLPLMFVFCVIGFFVIIIECIRY